VPALQFGEAHGQPSAPPLRYDCLLSCSLNAVRIANRPSQDYWLVDRFSPRLERRCLSDCKAFSAELRDLSHRHGIKLTSLGPMTGLDHVLGGNRGGITIITTNTIAPNSVYAHENAQIGA